MARTNLGRLFSSISDLSAPKLAVPYTRCESVTRSASNSASRFISCSTQQQQQEQQEQEANQERLKKQQEEEQGTIKAGSENQEDYEGGDYINKKTGEIGGPRGPEPIRFGDWERNGRCSDF